MAYWLLKTEPEAFSIDDLKREKISPWDGVRNYQARNFMRDDMQKGDRVFIYHSGTERAIVGEGRVVSDAYPDPTQFQKKEKHYDSKSSKENPRWVLVDIAFQTKYTEPITLAELKNDPFFEDMVLTQKGSRLSIQPVQKKHFDRIANFHRSK